jgi:hypothetical protein
LHLGPVQLTLSDSRTAQVFHVVDQLSKWGPRTHVQYAAWAEKELPLDAQERAMLAAHARLRGRRGVGALDQAFYVDEPIADATQDAIDKKLLAPEDAKAERALLDHFAPRLEPLLAEQKPAIETFIAELSEQAKAVAPLAAQLGRLCETEETVPVQAFLVPDPSTAAGDGELMGGRLVMEVIADDDNSPTFFHELFHAVIERRRGSIAIAAQKCAEPIDPETMEEGLAYAFAPGLVHPSGPDALATMVADDQGRALVERDVRFARLGLSLRTELASALEGGHETLGAFLPKECDAWGKLAAH